MKDPISHKLMEIAVKVDDYIFSLLESRKPETLYDASKHLIEAGGKRLRPYLVIKCCELVGGDSELAIPFAAALEIVHNFTLVHDDIMDNDALRRGKPTVHIQWGVPIAIASGDLLFAKAYQALYEPYKQKVIPIEKILKCIEHMTDALISTCEGQVLDISYPDVTNISENEYLYMVEGKTSSLFRACAEIGSIVGGGNEKETKLLGDFANNAGIAFQIMDDVLGLTTDEKTLGKPIGSDLREGKKTLVVIHALTHASQKQIDALFKVLGNNDANLDEIEKANKVLHESGSIKYAIKLSNEYALKADNILSKFPDSIAKSDLLEILEYFISRTY
jgi:geranylgeranyl diphosphate synthase type I